MRVLVAPDRFATLLAAADAAETMSAGWSASAPHDLIDTVALTDGGPGFLDAVAAARGGVSHAVTAIDPWGRPVPAAVLVVEAAGERTAYLEAAQTCGAHLRRPDDDPATGSSAGLGQVLDVAIEVGARRVVVGLGGAAAFDAGFGMLAALGGGSFDGGARRLRSLNAEELPDFGAATDRLRGVELVAAGDLAQPLLGLSGVAAVEAPTLGADPDTAHRIESALGHAVDLIRRQSPQRRDLLSGQPVRPDRVPGAGAGGGVGFALGLLGARLVSGPGLGAEEVGLPEALARADLVVTGTAVVGAECLRGSPVTAVAALAAERGVPVVVLAGRVEAGRRETMAAGLSGTYAAADSLRAWPRFAATPAETLLALAERVARTWSPGEGRPGS